MADLSRVWVRIFIPETDLGIISIGSKAMIIPDSQPDKPIYGSVTWIAEEAEFTPKNIQTRDARADLVYAVKISAPNPDGILKIGMPVDAVVEGFPEYDRYR